MSFELQDDGHCGVASTLYALSLHGFGQPKREDLDEADLRRVFAKKRRQVVAAGVDEHDIARAARKMGLQVKAHSYRRNDPDRVLRDLKKVTAKEHSAIVCWHGDDDDLWFHWVCVAGFTAKGRVLLFDPNLTDDDMASKTFRAIDPEYNRAPGFMSDARFRNWLVPVVEPDDGMYHYFLELWPSNDAAHRYVPGMLTESLLIEMARDTELISHFDEYMDDLRTIFGPPSQLGRGESAHEFLVRHRDQLLDTVSTWTVSAFAPRKYFERELQSLIALTECYRFRVPPDGERQILLDLGVYLGWRACERSYEVGRYDEEEDDDE